MTLYIKNMVCPRCIMAVRQLLQNNGITAHTVSLGEVQLDEELAPKQLSKLREELLSIGFELLDDPRQQIVAQIRSSVIEWIETVNNRPKLSAYLQSKLNREYSSLSKLHTEVKGITIEQYMKLVRIERIKEELCYGQKSISELSYIYGFSSLAHLSAQFKSVTGMSPKQFQQLERPAITRRRASLDQL